MSVICLVLVLFLANLLRLLLRYVETEYFEERMSMLKLVGLQSTVIRWLAGGIALGVLFGSWGAFFAGDVQAQSSIAKQYQERKRAHNTNTVTIMAAGRTGTYAAIVQDLQSVLDEPDKENGLRILPVLGLGGGSNVLDILFLDGVEMGITQQEHLKFFQKRNPELHARIYERIHYVTKLYNAEYHLLARKDIKTFEDLRGKKVSFYKEMSATDIAGKTIFDILGIDVEPSYDSLEGSVAKLRSGEIAATTRLAGAPVPGFVSLVKEEDDFHFIPLSPETLQPGQYEQLLEVFLPAQLSHDPYPDLVSRDEPVQTVASGAVLAVYNWSEGSDRYNKVANFVRNFFSNFDKFLQEARHPKWREINLAAEVPGWTRFKAAQEWLDENRDTASTEVKQQFDAFLKQQTGSQQLSDEQKDALFSEFVKWRQARQEDRN